MRWSERQRVDSGGRVSGPRGPRDLDGEGRTRSERTGDGRLPAKRLRDVTNDGQAEARTPCLAGAGRIDAVETFEDPVEVAGGNAYAGVIHAEYGAIAPQPER